MYSVNTDFVLCYCAVYLLCTRYLHQSISKLSTGRHLIKQYSPLLGDLYIDEPISDGASHVPRVR